MVVGTGGRHGLRLLSPLLLEVLLLVVLLLALFRLLRQIRGRPAGARHPLCAIPVADIPRYRRIGVVTRLWSRSHDSAPHSPKSPRPRNLYYGRLAERHPSEAVPALHIRRYARTAMSASTPGSGPPTGREPALDSRPLTRGWSRALVGGMALAVAAVAIVHLAATFLYNAPANPVSQRYARSVNWWMEPLFSQNWRLFAPNPISENVE